MEKARNIVRQRVASEILSTEKSYVNSLILVSKVSPRMSRVFRSFINRLIVQQLLDPVRQAGNKILTPQEIQNLFWNWDELCEHHIKFLRLLHGILTRMPSFDVPINSFRFICRSH